MGIYVGNKRYALFVGNTRRKAVVPSSLPYDAEIEYLQTSTSSYDSDRTYIDTGYIPTANTKAVVEFEIAVSRNINKNGFFGSRWGALRFCCTTFTNGSKFAFAMTNNSWPSTTFSTNANTRYICSAENGKYSLNGVEYTTPTLSSFSTTEHFLLFAVKSSSGQLLFGNDNYSAQRVYSCKIYESDVLQMDLIPVRIGTTGYLYDKVSHQLFGSARTGSFILGPDKT